MKSPASPIHGVRIPVALQLITQQFIDLAAELLPLTVENWFRGPLCSRPLGLPNPNRLLNPVRRLQCAGTRQKEERAREQEENRLPGHEKAPRKALAGPPKRSSRAEPPFGPDPGRFVSPQETHTVESYRKQVSRGRRRPVFLGPRLRSSLARHPGERTRHEPASRSFPCAGATPRANRAPVH